MHRLRIWSTLLLCLAWQGTVQGSSSSPRLMDKGTLKSEIISALARAARKFIDEQWEDRVEGLNGKNEVIEDIAKSFHREIVIPFGSDKNGHPVEDYIALPETIASIMQREKLHQASDDQERAEALQLIEESSFPLAEKLYEVITNDPARALTNAIKVHQGKYADMELPTSGLSELIGSSSFQQLIDKVRPTQSARELFLAPILLLNADFKDALQNLDFNDTSNKILSSFFNHLKEKAGDLTLSTVLRNMMESIGKVDSSAPIAMKTMRDRLFLSFVNLRVLGPVGSSIVWRKDEKENKYKRAQLRKCLSIHALGSDQQDESIVDESLHALRAWAHLDTNPPQSPTSTKRRKRPLSARLSPLKLGKIGHGKQRSESSLGASSPPTSPRNNSRSAPTTPRRLAFLRRRLPTFGHTRGHKEPPIRKLVNAQWPKAASNNPDQDHAAAISNHLRKSRVGYHKDCQREEATRTEQIIKWLLTMNEGMCEQLLNKVSSSSPTKGTFEMATLVNIIINYIDIEVRNEHFVEFIAELIGQIGSFGIELEVTLTSYFVPILIEDMLAIASQSSQEIDVNIAKNLIKAHERLLKCSKEQARDIGKHIRHLNPVHENIMNEMVDPAEQAIAEELTTKLDALSVQ